MDTKIFIVGLLVFMVGFGSYSLGLDIVSPSFGYTYAAGGDPFSYQIPSMELITLTTPSDFDRATSLTVQIAGINSGVNARALVYASNGQLLASGSIISLPEYIGFGVTDFVSFPISFTGSPNTIYKFGIVSDGGFWINGHPGSDYLTQGQQSYLATPPSTLPAGTQTYYMSLQLYVTYIATPTPTASPYVEPSTNPTVTPYVAPTATPYVAPTPTPTPQVALTIGSYGNGYTTPQAGTYSYNVNTQVSMTATPQTGNVFSYWLLNDGSKTYSPTLTLTLSVSRSALAVFTALPSPTPSPAPYDPSASPTPYVAPTPTPPTVEPTPLPVETPQPTEAPQNTELPTFESGPSGWSLIIMLTGLALAAVGFKKKPTKQ